jgi:two-component system, cell cycle sensor histidine kinase and response regulator CckA
MVETRPATILVVDDEEPIRAMLARFLALDHHTALCAATAEEALQILGEREVDLILLDLHMPGLYDGEQLLFLLRDRGSSVPIVVVSGWVDDEATVNGPECVCAVLKKPISSRRLLDTVRRALADR